MADDWSFQASFKFGPHSGSMLNVRADDADELVGKSLYLTAKLREGNTFADLQVALDGLSGAQAVSNVQQAFPNAQPISQGVQQQPQGWDNRANVAPICKHGPMKDLQHKNYKSRWYCAAPYGTPKDQQCSPQG